MKPHRSIWVWVQIAALACAATASANDSIPKAAWKRPLGLPLENAGTKKAASDAGHIDDGYWQGAPVGGFGAGTFSRSYRGDFVRWHLKTAVDKYQAVPLNQFSVYERAEGGQPVATALYAGKPRGQGKAAPFKYDYPVGAGDYYALYPKAWYDYRWEKLPARLTLEQFSPILPNNYKESSYPVAVYLWHAQNPTKQKVTVSVMLSWTNMIGWFQDSAPNFSHTNNLSNVNLSRSEDIQYEGQAAKMKGIVFARMRNGDVQAEGDGQFVIASLDSPRTQVSYLTTFADAGQSVWFPFQATGKLLSSDQSWASGDEPLAGAIAVTFTLEPGDKLTVPMVIAWDLPVVEFASGRRWLRRYTDFFGSSGTHGWEIAKEGLLRGREWSDTIDAWQKPIVEDESKPLWYRGALFNELYILADGGTLWGRPQAAEKSVPPSFAYLEGFDYTMYSTLDVLFYGSMPLAKWWPDIDKQMMRTFAEFVPQDLSQKQLVLSDFWRQRKLVFRSRKAKGAVPHDLGAPAEDPIVYPNRYGWQDGDRFKDLNSQFVLMVYRDFVLTGSTDLAFLKSTWPAVREALQYLRQFDHDGGGVPENEGIADQTYDNWPARGQMAYCGSLWLAAVRSAEEIAKKLGDEKAAAEYRELFERSQKTYISKLWNGEYFRYDTKSEYRDDIHVDQLAGQMYANLLGLGDLVPREMRLSALHKIFDYNVMKFDSGKMGAVNGMESDGTPPSGNEQVEEVWAGVTYALAAEMLAEGMKDEAFRAAWGVYHVTYESKGYWFRTPEAWDSTGNFRASMYMRPPAIWAMEMVPAKK